MNRIASFLLLFLVKSVTSQPLDWAGDQTVFGTTSDEHHPVLIASGPGTLQAFCVVADDTLAFKRSSTDGDVWSTANKIRSPLSSPRMLVVADSDYSYVFCRGAESSFKHLYRLAPSANEWSAAWETELPPGFGANVDALAAATDVAAQPDEPFLNVCWYEGAQVGVDNLWFVQSQDHGSTFLSPVLVHTSGLVYDLVVAGVAIAATWSGDEERVHIAATRDRPGSIPEEIKVFSSSNQGQFWNAGVSLDPATYPQHEPTLAAFGNSLFVAYSRRSEATAQRDIYFVYSPDGGTTFSDPVPLTDAATDDFDPRLIVDADGQTLHIFYLSGQVLAEESTLMLMTAPVAAPWDLSDPVAVSDSAGVVSSGDYFVSATLVGIAAVWTSRFALGDLDVKFDAAWRGNAVMPRSAFLPRASEITACYPNPFNGSATLTILTPAMQGLSLEVTDLLGRRVRSLSLETASPGTNTVHMNLPGLPTGTYWLSVRGSSAPPMKMMLLR